MHHTHKYIEYELFRGFVVVRRLRYTKSCWVGEHKSIMKRTDSPQPKASPTQEKKRLKSGVWATFSHTFSHSNCFFRGLGLGLCRKQTARSLTQSSSPRTGCFLARKKTRTSAVEGACYCCSVGELNSNSGESTRERKWLFLFRIKMQGSHGINSGEGEDEPTTELLICQPYEPVSELRLGA